MLCVVVAAGWAVTFDTELGDLPLMTAEITSGTIAVAEQTAGTTSNVECSNRGLCGTYIASVWHDGCATKTKG